MLKIKKSYYKLNKNRRLANKKLLTKIDIEYIKNEFKNWLIGIEEDDPLPYEINYLCFCFDFKNKNVNLSLSGYENNIDKIDDGIYFPLEAQFFNCPLLNSFFNNKKNLNNNNELFYYVKQKIYKMFVMFLKSFTKLKDFEFYKNKKIIIGEKFKNKEFSFVFRNV